MKNRQALPKADKHEDAALRIEASKSTPWKFAFLLAFFGFLLYANSIPNDYALDDAGAVNNNLFVQKGLRGIPDILTVDLWHFDNVNLGYYRPLSLITLAVEYQFFKANPHISHFINALLFALSMLVLFLLLQRIFKNEHPAFAFIVTALFACHPIHTEVVANIKSRDEILSFLNLIAALYFLLRFNTNKKLSAFVLSGLFFYLALMSKESAITGIALVPIVLYFTGLRDLKKGAFQIALFAGVAALFLIQKKILMGTLSGTVPDDIINYPYIGADARMATSILVLTTLIKQLIYPFNLCYDYSYNAIPVGAWNQPLVLLGLLLLIGMAIYFYLRWPKLDLFSLSIVIFIITLAPALGFIILRGGIMAERFLYAPSLGFCIALAGLSTKVFKATSEKDDSITNWFKKNANLSFALLLIMLVFSIKTIRRNTEWKDNFTLFSTDILNNPNSAQNHRHLGSEYINKAIAEKNDEAKKREYFNKGVLELQKAIAIHPKFGDAFFKLGVAYHAVYLNVDSAVYYYTKASEYAPGFALPYNNMGIIYQSLKKYDMASYYYNMAMDANPNFPDAKKNAADLKAATGLDIHLMPVDMNLDSLQKNTEKKDDNFYFNMGTFAASKGDYNGAIANLQMAIKLNPKNEDALINLGNCFGVTNRFQESIEVTLQVLKFNPQNERAWQNLAISYTKLGNKSKADDALEQLNALKNH